MYAELELLGVGLAILAEAWLRAPRRRHAAILFGPGPRRIAHPRLDVPRRRRALRPRRTAPRSAKRGAGAAAIAGRRRGVGRSVGFRVPRADAGRSLRLDSAAPHRRASSTPSRASSPTEPPPRSASSWSSRPVGCSWPVATGVLPGCGVACFVIPLALAALAGLVAPVLLDRTLTMTAWAPALAVGVALDALLTRQRVLGIVAVGLGGAARACRRDQCGRRELRRRPRPPPPRGGGATRRRRRRTLGGQGPRGATGRWACAAANRGVR